MRNKRISDYIVTYALVGVLGVILYMWHWVFGDYLFAFSIALTFWYVAFGFECAMNGGTRAGLTMPFYYMGQDFLCNIPFYGKKHRLKLSNGDQDWADAYPGIIHFTFMHIIIPMGIYYGLLKLLGAE